MRRLRVDDELATDRLRGLEEGADSVHVASRKRDDRQLLSEGCEESDRLRPDVGLGESPPRIVRRYPGSFRAQDDRFRRRRGSDEVLRSRLPWPVVGEVLGLRARALV